MFEIIVVGSTAAFLAATAALEMADAITDHRRLSRVTAPGIQLARSSIQASRKVVMETTEPMRKAA